VIHWPICFSACVRTSEAIVLELQHQQALEALEALRDLPLELVVVEVQRLQVDQLAQAGGQRAAQVVVAQNQVRERRSGAQGQRKLACVIPVLFFIF
jgi:ABC-type branched-subunit amino acid transport system substrate-binding protein